MDYSNMEDLLGSSGSGMPEVCISPNLTSPSAGCILSTVESGKRDAIAGLRIISSLLSILGAFTIIASAIAKRQVSSPKVHPIFVLSIADCLLAVLWVTGGCLWLSGAVQSRVSCFSVSLLTVILECVTVNLTLVYALFAYVNIKQTNIDTILVSFNNNYPWSASRIVFVYFVAWLLPAVLVLIPFGGLALSTSLLEDSNSCSCWCIPEFANVLPFARPVDKATTQYVYNLRKLIVSFGAIVGVHYLTIFILLVVFYVKILRHIQRMRRINDQNRSASHYGAMEAIITKGHSQAKSRVVLFLTVFVICGLCNLILAFLIVIVMSYKLSQGATPVPSFHVYSGEDNIGNTILSIILVQSITVPLQGFLNAIVYGWTREDFLHIMVPSTNAERQPTRQPVPDRGSEFEGSKQLLSDDSEEQRRRTPEYLSGNFS